MIVPGLVTIGQLARIAGLPKNTAARRINALDAQHGGLLVDVGMHHKRISTRRLFEVSADFIGANLPTRAEFEDLQRRILRIERKLGLAD